MNPIKIVSISLLSLAMAACGGGGGGPSGTSEEVETSEEIEEAVTVGTANIGRKSGDDFVSGELQLDLSTISSGGIANISASVVDITKNNELIKTQSYAIVFNSVCADKTPAKALFSADNNTVITSTGNVEVSYTASGCVGVDEITATLYEESAPTTPLATASADITVESAEFGAISFVSNSETALSFTGIANSVLKSSNIVTFIVTDTFGNPIEGVDVSFALSSQSTASTASLASVKATTNAAGEAKTTVNAGTSHGLLSVIATTVITPDATKPTETVTKISSSLPISVSTGLASQSGFSISADKFSVDAYAFDGAVVKVNVRLNDHLHNPVPEGTIVNFTAESGSITSFCAVDAEGACSVDWNSQGARPGDYPANTAGAKNKEYLPQTPIQSPPVFSLQDVKGFTTITAYAIGEAGFLDGNGNGIFDRDENTNIDEPFEAYPEVFRDDNGNNIYDVNDESFFEFVQDGIYTAAPSVYQGPLCNAAASNAGHCASNTYVTQSIRIVQSNGQNPYVARFYKKVGANFVQLTSADTFNVSTDGEVYLLVTDTNGNIPAAGVEISFVAENYKDIDSRTVKAKEAQYITEPGFPENRGLLHSFTIRPDAGATATDLEVTIPGSEGKAVLRIAP